MFALNDNFAWLVWVPFGMSLSLLPMPRCLLLVVPTVLLAMGFYGGLPDNFSPPELLKFATFAMGLAVYSAVIYLPLALLRGRFQREWTFHQLEQSHRDLEEAHQQLEEAAVHERELAVLRERGRLARDMHDTLGHSLALIAVKLEAAQRLRPVDPDRADHEVLATQAIARDALAELRAAIADLRVPGNAHERSVTPSSASPRKAPPARAGASPARLPQMSSQWAIRLVRRCCVPAMRHWPTSSGTPMRTLST